MPQKIIVKMPCYRYDFHSFIVLLLILSTVPWSLLFSSVFLYFLQQQPFKDFFIFLVVWVILGEIFLVLMNLRYLFSDKYVRYFFKFFLFGGGTLLGLISSIPVLIKEIN